jgi:transposase-like protein
MPARMDESGAATPPVEGRALERYRLIEPYLHGARTLASIAGQADVSLRTAQRWVDLYRKHGLEALALSPARNAQPISKASVVIPESVELIH